jgi:hypothetical protein
VEVQKLIKCFSVTYQFSQKWVYGIAKSQPTRINRAIQAPQRDSQQLFLLAEGSAHYTFSIQIEYIQIKLVIMTDTICGNSEKSLPIISLRLTCLQPSSND